MAICNEPLPQPSKVITVPKWFDAWFARAAAREPNARFQSALEATSELRAICGLDSVRISESSILPDVPKAAPEEPAAFLATAAPSSVTIAGLHHSHRRTWMLIGLPALALL